MHDIPRNVINLALEINDGDLLSIEQQSVCDEWDSGAGTEYMKISFDDPKLLSFIGLYNRCLKNINNLCNDLF